MKTIFTLLLTLASLHSFAKTTLESENITTDTLQAFPASAASMFHESSLASTAQAEAYPKNTVKLNLSSLVLNNYSFSYERSFHRKFSVVGGFSFVPKTKATSIFLIDKLTDKFVDEDDEILDDFEEFTLASKTFTGEVRYYTGKHPGARGFYVSLYGRYMNMNVNYPLTYETGDKEYLLPFDGKVKGLGAGLMIGAQWLIVKNITLDWYILGAHYGKTTVDLPAKANLGSMTAAEKRDLQNDFESLNDDFGSASLKANVTDRGVDLSGKAPFAGIRGFGINVGYTF